MKYLTTNAELKRREILEATFQCAYAEGLVRMTTRSIAKKANVFQSTLQYYFRNKETLLKEFIQALFDRMIHDVQRRFVESDPPEKKLEAVFQAGRFFCEKQREMFVVFISCWALCVRNPHLGTELSKLYRRFLKVFEDILAEGEKSGAFKKVNRESMAVFIISFVQGLSLLKWNMPDKSFRVLDHYDIFVRTLRSFILKNGPEKS